MPNTNKIRLLIIQLNTAYMSGKLDSLDTASVDAKSIIKAHQAGIIDLSSELSNEQLNWLAENIVSNSSSPPENAHSARVRPKPEGKYEVPPGNSRHTEDYMDLVSKEKKEDEFGFGPISNSGFYG